MPVGFTERRDIRYINAKKIILSVDVYVKNVFIKELEELETSHFLKQAPWG